MGVYLDELEKYILEESDLYYTNECNNDIGHLLRNSFPDYLKKIERRAHEEEQLAISYFHQDTLPKINNAFNKIMIENYIENYEEKFDHYLNESILYGHKFEDLTRMYKLISRIDYEIGIKKFKQIFNEHAYKTGMNRIEQCDDKVIIYELYINLFNKIQYNINV